MAGRRSRNKSASCRRRGGRYPRLPANQLSATCASARPERAVEDPLGDLAHTRALAHRCALDERERLGLLHPALVHQEPLGAVDQLARLELLAERVDLAGEVAQLAEAPDRDLDRRNQVALLERLDEVGQGAG